MLTLKNLKSMVEPAPGKLVGMPSFRQLEESGTEIVVREMVSDIQITVYQNGYVACRRGKEATVFRLHDCGGYIYDTAIYSRESVLAKDVFENEQWYIRLYLEAEDRLNANYERKKRRHQVSLDSMVADYCRNMGDYTWDGQTDLLEREDMKQFKKFLKMMTEKQQRVILLYFVERKGTKDIAEELGVSYQAVSDMLKKAINRVRKKEGLPVSGIPRGVYNHSMRRMDTDEE